MAATAGVSVTTVSDALNGKGRISEETRARVRQIADDLGYRPSSLARSLRVNRTFLLGVVVTKYGQMPWNFTHMPFYSKVIDAAMTTSLDHGYAISVLPADRDIEFILSFPFDGLLVLDPRSKDPLVLAARKRGIPVVADRANAPDPGQLWVDFDHELAVAAMCERLSVDTDRSPVLLVSDGDDSYTARSKGAYERWCQEQGKPAVVLSGSKDLNETRAVVRATLGGSAPPSAIFGLEDYHATILVEEAQRAGLRTPADIILGCFTEIPHGQPPIQQLTVSPDIMGAHGIQLLVDAIEGRPLREELSLVPYSLLA